VTRHRRGTARQRRSTSGDNDLPVNGKVTYTPCTTTSGSGPTPTPAFGPVVSRQAKQFAEFFIEKQPVTYLRVVGKDVLHTFGWNREPDPGGVYETANGNGPTFRFISGSALTRERPWYTHPTHLPAPRRRATATRPASAGTAGGPGPGGGKGVAGEGLGATRAVGPWDSILRWVSALHLPARTLLALIVLIGLAGVLARWRRWGGLALLPWLVGALMIVLPPMTAGFSYRYVLAAIPLPAWRPAWRFAREPGDVSRRRVAGLRRHLGRGRPSSRNSVRCLPGRPRPGPAPTRAARRR